MPSTLTRRAFALGTACAAGLSSANADRREVGIVAAPVSLGLRPGARGQEPGTWRAPEVLLAAGLAEKIPSRSLARLPRPRYEFDQQPGTRIRNGNTLRTFMLSLADAVKSEFDAGRFPLVLGGDCSVMLGCLAGARRAGARGLIHVDGHSDFFHPGNYDTGSRLGTAAGMDLALATGRGEKLLTEWPGIDGPLVADADVVQAGERDAENPDYRKYYGDVLDTAITQLTVQRIRRDGIALIAQQIIGRLAARKLDRAWVHVDLDVLDEKVMDAVDSPGTPGLDFAQLTELLRTLIGSGRICGLDVCIYDPDLDRRNRFAGPIADSIAAAMRG
jgi:arginase